MGILDRLVILTVILEVLPALIAIFTGFASLFLLEAVMILYGGGDITIILKLLCFRKATEYPLYIDHSYQGGLVAFTR